jgi:hypothetical protein
MGETPEAELEILQARASAVHCYCNRHRTWDPARGGGDLWLQWRRRFRDDRGSDLDLLHYADAATVRAALSEIEAQYPDTRRADMRLSFRHVTGRLQARERPDGIGR